MIQGYDPRTGKPAGDPVAETPDVVVDEIARAAAAASKEWASEPWPTEPWPREPSPSGQWASEPAHGEQVADAGGGGRPAALAAVADALDARAAELAAVADAETALGTGRLAGEVARTTGQLRMFGDALADGGYRDVIVSSGGDAAPWLGHITRPIGPVAVFAASNFPFAFSIAGGDTASALAAGCPVVVKAHECHPQTSVLTGQIVAEALAGAGAPAGVFAVVHGVDAGLRLLRHPAISAAGFTGSTRGGLALAQVCAERSVPIPFFGELGSVNPVIVLPGAAAARAGQIAAGYASSLTLGAGQFCTNPGLLFIPSSEPGLVDAVAQAVRGATGGPMLSGRIHDSYRAAVADLARSPAVSTLASGNPGEGPWAATPQVFATSLEHFADGLPGLAEERFGPAGLVITYTSAGDLPPVLARLGGNLAGVIHGEESSAADMAAAAPVAAALTHAVGRLVWNGWPTGVAVTWAQHHGGPWAATTDPHYTSVGATAIRRWLVPVAYQDFPDVLLPGPLRDRRGT